MAESELIGVTRDQLYQFWRSALIMAIHECDRAALDAGGEPYRQFMLKHAPGGHGPMGHRLSAMLDHMPANLPSQAWCDANSVHAPEGWQPWQP